MKTHLLVFLLVMATSCGKKVQKTVEPDDPKENLPPYDTLATDSFSIGATPGNVVLHRDSIISVKKDSLPKPKQENSLKEFKTDGKKLKKIENETKSALKPDLPKPESAQPTL